MDIYEIDAGLYQSGTLPESLSILHEPGISAVVDLEHHPHSALLREALPPGSMVYTWYPIDDGPMPDAATVRAIARFVAALLACGRKVLVHCSGGLNRSGLVVARTLIERGIPAEEAIRIVRKRRGQDALFNREFERWLLAEAVEA
jgi:protein-tyrosine phosphatase